MHGSYGLGNQQIDQIGLRKGPESQSAQVFLPLCLGSQGCPFLHHLEPWLREFPWKGRDQSWRIPEGWTMGIQNDILPESGDANDELSLRKRFIQLVSMNLYLLSFPKRHMKASWKNIYLNATSLTTGRLSGRHVLGGVYFPIRAFCWSTSLGLSTCNGILIKWDLWYEFWSPALSSGWSLIKS